MSLVYALAIGWAIYVILTLAFAFDWDRRRHEMRCQLAGKDDSIEGISALYNGVQAQLVGAKAERNSWKRSYEDLWKEHKELAATLNERSKATASTSQGMGKQLDEIAEQRDRAVASAEQANKLVLERDREIEQLKSDLENNRNALNILCQEKINSGADHTAELTGQIARRDSIIDQLKDEIVDLQTQIRVGEYHWFNQGWNAANALTKVSMRAEDNPAEQVRDGKIKVRGDDTDWEKAYHIVSDNYVKEAGDLTAEIVQLKAEIERLKGLELLNELNVERETALRAEVERHAGLVAEAREILTESDEIFTEYDEEIEELKAELEECNEVMVAAFEALTKDVEEIEHLKALLSERAAEIDHYAKAILDWEAENQALKAQLASTAIPPEHFDDQRGKTTKGRKSRQ